MVDNRQKFTLYTLGCKVNQEEGMAMAALFRAAGYQQVSFQERADLYIINTCTVTHVADRKCRAVIRRAVKANPEAFIVVTGCYAQVAAAEIAKIKGVDLIAGVNERASLVQLVKECWEDKTSAARQVVGDISQVKKFMVIGDDGGDQSRARAYLKIEDGCDQFCHYCLIPYARGPVRSLPLKEAVQRAQVLLDLGYQEMVLSGIHIGAYGQDLAGHNLEKLLHHLCSLPGKWRLRLGSLEPQQLSDSLLKLISCEERICPHVHIPLQSGCDQTLMAMGRKYSTKQYATLLKKLRDFNPQIAVTSDLMVGYPGETKDDFERSLNFCQEMSFADVHVFPYSRRQGTPAFKIPKHVDQISKNQRVARINTEVGKMRASYRQSFVGKKVEFLPERQFNIDNVVYWQGHSENYLPVCLPASDGLRGQLISVRIKKMDDKNLLWSRKI
ncbi:MAG: tRNA (N(6)-L-threonylcarbamoyladenosine(37)-C(2))-methylthiotransferase MtaB [Bacillota bacterium]|jgi:threonylcarbamoyladenosine tRNA methylthiotransferase MtaB